MFWSCRINIDNPYILVVETEIEKRKEKKYLLSTRNVKDDERDLDHDHDHYVVIF